jgi:hypothetical protein
VLGGGYLTLTGKSFSSVDFAAGSVCVCVSAALHLNSNQIHRSQRTRRDEEHAYNDEADEYNPPLKMYSLHTRARARPSARLRVWPTYSLPFSFHRCTPCDSLQHSPSSFSHSNHPPSYIIITILWQVPSRFFLPALSCISELSLSAFFGERSHPENLAFQPLFVQ